MKAIDLIRWAMETTQQGTTAMAGDLADAPLTPPIGGGNHPLWKIGHLAFIDGNLPHVLLGEPHAPTLDGVWGSSR